MTASLLEELDTAISTGTPEKRERALWHATDLFMVGRFTEDEIWLFGEIIGRLANEIEGTARTKLAEKMARIDHAPVQVINALASDEAAAVACPVLRHSSRVDPRALLEIARTNSQAHLLAISQRQSIPEPITDVLVKRGDQTVLQSVASNDGAQISEKSFLNLVKRSENDTILAECVGLRSDIPRHVFQQLISKASDETRRKLQRERPELATLVNATVADVASTLHSKFGPASQRYFSAKKAISKRISLGSLTESNIREYACARQMEEVIVGLSHLCSLPSNVTERALTERSREMLLIIAKASAFSWDTTTALLFLGAPEGKISSSELSSLKNQFMRLNTASSKEVLSHYHARRNARAVVRLKT